MSENINSLIEKLIVKIVKNVPIINTEKMKCNNPQNNKTILIIRKLDKLEGFF